MAPQQEPGCCLHGGHIERVRNPPSISILESGSCPSIPNPILIPFPQGAEAGMKFPSNVIHPSNPYVRRQQRVEAPMEGQSREAGRRVKVGHLLQGVNTCIGSARCNHPTGVLGDRLNARFDHLLNGEDPGLNLPTMIPATVVFEDQSNLSFQPHLIL